jgi:hypothetical protein
MRARYAGTCTRTGKHYAAGAEITKGSRGWELARSSASTTASAAPQPDRRHVRRPDGEIREADISRPLYCGACCNAAGIDRNAANTPDDLSPYSYSRQGDDFACPRCGAILHILSEDEIWAEVTLPALYVTDDLSLSRRIGPTRWESVKHLFEYTSFADLADLHDQMDNFDLAAQYEGRKGGEWFLKGADQIPAVEELLGILPENRWDARHARETAEREAERVAEQIHRAERQRAEEALHLRVLDYQEAHKRWRETALAGLVYTMATPAVKACPDWQPAGDPENPKKKSGGFDSSWGRTEIDGQTVYANWFGNAVAYYAPQSLVNAWVDAAWESRVDRYGLAQAARFTLAVWLRHEGMHTPGGRGDTQLDDIDLNRIDRFGAEHFIALARTEDWLLTRQPTEADRAELRFASHWGSWSETVLAEHFNLPHAYLTLVDASKAELAEIASRLAGRLDIDAARSPRDLDQVWQHPDGRRFVTSRYQGGCLFLDIEATGALPIAYEYEVKWPYEECQALRPLLDLDSFDQIGIPRRTPAGRLLVQVTNLRGEKTARIDISHITPEMIALSRAGQAAEARAQAEQRAVAILQKAADKEARRIAGATLVELPAITAIVSRETLDKREEKSQGLLSRSGSYAELEKIAVRLQGGAETTLYLITHGWWSMGEDGDADETLSLRTNEAEARARFQEDH